MMFYKFLVLALWAMVSSVSFGASIVVKGNVADYEFTWLGTSIDQLETQCDRLHQRTPAASFANEVVVSVDRLPATVLVNADRNWGNRDIFCGDLMTYIQTAKGIIPHVVMDECHGEWAKGEVRQIYIHHGYQQRLCNQYGEINVMQTVCDARYTESNFLCKERSTPVGGRCRNGLESGQQKLEIIPYGQRYVYCDNGRLELISVTCDILYQIEGDHCVRIPGW